MDMTMSGAVGGNSMESGDWRSHLQADSRQRIVNRIMDTLKRHLPYSGDEGLQELKKIAVRFEEKIYTAATSLNDYLRKISLKILTMETRPQSPMPDTMQFNSGANSVHHSDPGVHPNIFANQTEIPGRQQQRAMPEASSTSLDSTAHMGNANGGEWQEEVYQKIKEDLHLLDLNDNHKKTSW